MQRQRREMRPSLFGSWQWAAPDFVPALTWLNDHPKKIRKGTYLSGTPDKEVWRFSLPVDRQGEAVIYKSFSFENMPLRSRLGSTPALKEAVNYVGLRAIGIPVPELLACGETRRMGLLTSAFIITRNIQDSQDGSTLGPTGNLREHESLRTSFCRRCMELLALAHQGGFLHRALFAHKVLFVLDKDSAENAPELTWIDVASCTYQRGRNLNQDIPRDLVNIFVDLRLSAEEIQRHLAHYLECNPGCGYTPDTLWTALTRLKRT
ncbi:MAG: hypothetical protein IJJ33_01955 [Victivallales bacterium]|nr:hypothetical protein [Victivallales bacterium]